MPHTPSSGGPPITPRIREVETRHDHALREAIENLRRERAAEDSARKHESELNHRVAQTRFNNLEEATAEAFKDIKKELREQTEILNSILMQAMKTNGRVEGLEKVVGEDETKGLRGGIASLEKDRTRALQTIGILATIGGICWLFLGDEIKARGVLNPTAQDVARQVDTIIERRVQAAALKPNP